MKTEKKDWKLQVNAILVRRIGLGMDDMPDTCWADRKADGMSPEEAAQDILEEWADNGDIPEELL